MQEIGGVWFRTRAMEVASILPGMLSSRRNTGRFIMFQIQKFASFSGWKRRK